MVATISRVFSFARRLEDAGIPYELSIQREDAIMFTVCVPHERWEIELLADGSIEVEVYKSFGETGDERMLARLFERHGR